MANHLTQWRPSAGINLMNFKWKSERFSTYRELKKNIPELIKESYDDEVHVTRTKRGEWGEWFETWGLSDNGKPKIIKQGWM